MARHMLVNHAKEVIGYTNVTMERRDRSQKQINLAAHLEARKEVANVLETALARQNLASATGIVLVPRRCL